MNISNYFLFSNSIDFLTEFGYHFNLFVLAILYNNYPAFRGLFTH